MGDTCWEKLEFHYKEPSPEYIEKELRKIEQQINEFCNVTEIDIEITPILDADSGR